MSFLDNSEAMEVTGKIMAITIIILFMVVLFFLFLHLYARWYVWNTELPPQRLHNRRRFVFNSDRDPVVQNGLEISVLRSIPVLKFNSKEFKDGLECAVCLFQVVEGEKARVLPKCSHGFHVDCIDMWFQSHSTCPLCRSLVSVDCETQQKSGGSSPEILGSGQVMESLNFPTNVLFWGDQCQVTSAENGGGRLEEGTSSSPPSSSSSSSRREQDELRIIDVLENGGEEECKSPEPTPTRLRSLKRLWSREKRLSPGTCSGHVEV